MSTDKLKELFREKLYNHETPVQQSDWEIISERLKAKRKRKIVPLFYVYSTAGIVAALLIVMLLLKPESKNVSDAIIANVDTQNIENNENTVNEIDTAATTDNNNSVLANKNETNRNTVNKNNFYASANANKTFDLELEQSNNTVTANTPEELVANNENGQPNTLVENIEKQIETAENKQPEQVEKKKTPQQNINNEWWNTPDTEINTKKTNSSWTFAFVSGQSVGNNSKTSDFTNEIWTTNYAQDNQRNLNSFAYTTMLGSDQKSLSSTPYASADKLKDMKHNRPLNFGVRIKKNINERIRIKTGLSYSYFLSELNKPDIKIQQKIYYVGVPVGAEFLLWEKNRFNLYASGEFAVEKGVAYYLNHSCRTLIETTEVFTHSNSVRGLQFSANAGLGISYSLIKNFGIYAEPNAVYYIKDIRQPQSFRTEKPFNFGLNVGLKYDF